MSRQIIFHDDHFLDFYKGLDIKVKEKIQYVFELIKQVDRKTPKNEIERAIRLKEEYFKLKEKML